MPGLCAPPHPVCQALLGGGCGPARLRHSLGATQLPGSKARFKSRSGCLPTPCSQHPLEGLRGRSRLLWTCTWCRSLGPALLSAKAGIGQALASAGSPPSATHAGPDDSAERRLPQGRAMAPGSPCYDRGNSDGQPREVPSFLTQSPLCPATCQALCPPCAPSRGVKCGQTGWA